MNLSSANMKSLPKTGRDKREKFLARASANTGMDRRFMSDGGSSAGDRKRPDDPVIFCLHRDGNVTYQKNKEKRPFTQDKYVIKIGPGTWRELDLNYEPDRKILKEFLINDKDFYDWVLKSNHTPQQAQSALGRASVATGGGAVWDTGMEVTSKVTGYVGMALTATGTLVVFIPGGQVIGGGMLVLGEGMVKVSTGVAVFNDFRKGDLKGAAINASFHFISRGVGNRLRDAQRLGFQKSYELQETNLINGLNQTFFNTSSMTITEGRKRINE